LKAQQELYRRLYGREETPPRKKFCVAYVNGNLGNSVGALFVKKYFDEQSKEDVSITNPYTVLDAVSVAIPILSQKQYLPV
jgi:predicted metalloendopeptidase